MDYYTRPFLKWAGGKSSISSHIVQLLPPGRVLVEPFVGSAAVFLATNYEKYILNDINADLINCFQAVKRHGAAFIIDAKEYFKPKYNTEKQYYKLRKAFNATRHKYTRALLFLYLNRHGYNGLCRYNRKGEFNVPFGKYKAPYFPERELHWFYLKSSRAQFSCKDFRTLFKNARQGQVFYCDPPYVPLSATAKFTDFASSAFTLEDQKILAAQAVVASKRGIPVVISNHETTFTKQLYCNADLKRLSVRRSISCDIGNRKNVYELLAYYAPERHKNSAVALQPIRSVHN